jgi:hypothetical protein
MTNANDCAYPADSQTQTEGGLTKREYFAALAMQGVCSTNQAVTAREVAEWSVKMADALITELNKSI